MANLELGDHYDRWIESLVDKGRYSTSSEVVRDGLRLLEERERSRDARLQTLRSAIAEGDASGEPEPMDMDSIKADGRRARRQRGA